MNADSKERDIARLMQKALTGDQQSYCEALEMIAKWLRPYLSKRLSNKSDHEDVLQEILISIHKARHTYDGERPFGPWMYAIAKFRLHDHLRARYSDQLLHAADLSAAEHISARDVTELGFNYEYIKEEIGQLPEKQALILQLMHGEGYTAKEVAEKISMKESAVKVSAHRAYKILKKKLAK